VGLQFLAVHYRKHLVDMHSLRENFLGHAPLLHFLKLFFNLALFVSLDFRPWLAPEPRIP